MNINIGIHVHIDKQDPLALTKWLTDENIKIRIEMKHIFIVQIV